jgi:hypothetical protein
MKCQRCNNNEGVKQLDVNNSSGVESELESEYLTEKDLDFEVEFNGADAKSLLVCSTCYSDIKF